MFFNNSLLLSEFIFSSIFLNVFSNISLHFIPFINSFLILLKKSLIDTISLNFFIFFSAFLNIFSKFWGIFD